MARCRHKLEGDFSFILELILSPQIWNNGHRTNGLIAMLSSSPLFVDFSTRIRFVKADSRDISMGFMQIFEDNLMWWWWYGHAVNFSQLIAESIKLTSFHKIFWIKSSKFGCKKCEEARKEIENRFREQKPTTKKLNRESCASSNDDDHVVVRKLSS